jgi:ankyrin repeat protein
VVERLVKEGAKVNYKKENGYTPLHNASWNGAMKVACFLIENGANINARNYLGETPLFLASYNGHTNVVCFLVEKGANVNFKKNDGWTPLHRAMYWSCIDAAFVLLNNGADLSIKDNDGNTALDIAANTNVATGLLKKLMVEKKQNNSEISALQKNIEAAETKQQKLVREQKMMKSEAAARSEKDKTEILALQDKIKSAETEQQKLVREKKKMKSEAAARSDKHKMEILALQEKAKLQIEEHRLILNIEMKKSEIASLQLKIQNGMQKSEISALRKKLERLVFGIVVSIGLYFSLPSFSLWIMESIDAIFPNQAASVGGSMILFLLCVRVFSELKPYRWRQLFPSSQTMIARSRYISCFLQAAEPKRC